MPHSNVEPRIRERARLRRQERTLGEKAMQEFLRSFRPYGARSRREAPIGPYGVDFAWLSGRIVIEVDGSSHDLPGATEQDAKRDAFLREQGFQVIRVRDADVIANNSAAFVRIEQIVHSRLKTPPLTPPHKGDGNRT